AGPWRSWHRSSASTPLASRRRWPTTMPVPPPATIALKRSTVTANPWGPVPTGPSTFPWAARNSRAPPSPWAGWRWTRTAARLWGRGARPSPGSTPPAAPPWECPRASMSAAPPSPTACFPAAAPGNTPPARGAKAPRNRAPAPKRISHRGEHHDVSQPGPARQDGAAGHVQQDVVDQAQRRNRPQAAYVGPPADDLLLSPGPGSDPLRGIGQPAAGRLHLHHLPRHPR